MLPPDVRNGPPGTIRIATRPPSKATADLEVMVPRDEQLAFDHVLVGTLPPRLASRIMVDPASGCWLWTGEVDRDGYGRISSQSAHRLVWLALRGPIPRGLELDHLCRVRSCVNALAHLEPVTHRENCLRGISASAMNARKAECDHGHPFDERNTYWYKGSRGCRICTAARQRKHRGRLREEREQAERAAQLAVAA